VKKPAVCARIDWEVYPFRDDFGGDRVAIVGWIDGAPVAELSAGVDVNERPQVFYVDTVTVKPAVRRCGVGTRLYELAAKAACDRGHKLASDRMRSAASHAFWKKQLQKGRARCISAADPVSAEQQARDFPGKTIRYGRGKCDRYELKSCSVSSLDGGRRRR
jgi:GNAT superfamily N-acetyltransferase